MNAPREVPGIARHLGARKHRATLHVTIDRVSRLVWSGGDIIRMHAQCGLCERAAPSTYAETPDDGFARERAWGAAKDAGWIREPLGGWTCVDCAVPK